MDAPSANDRPEDGCAYAQAFEHLFYPVTEWLVCLKPSGECVGICASKDEAERMADELNSRRFRASHEPEAGEPF